MTFPDKSLTERVEVLEAQLSELKAWFGATAPASELDLGTGVDGGTPMRVEISWDQPPLQGGET